MQQSTPARERVKVWDPPTRLFHWALVGSILVAFLSSEEDSALTDWHIPAGWVASVLIAFASYGGWSAENMPASPASSGPVTSPSISADCSPAARSPASATTRSARLRSSRCWALSQRLSRRGLR